jgi:hypothetical protein
MMIIWNNYYFKNLKFMKQTPKEKAVELINKFTIRTKFLDEFKGWIEIVDSSHAKQFALVAVDEILRIKSVNKDDILSNYWEEVEHEIEKL